jgi:Flp pilus assembly pilin Flp
MNFLTRTARIAEKALFAVTDPIVIPARAIGMFDRKRLGATAIEYGLIAASIAVAIIAVVMGLGSHLFHQ